MHRVSNTQTYVREQLTIHLVESCTKGQHPQEKSSSLLLAKRYWGGDRVPHSEPAKRRIPRRRRDFSTVPRRRNTGLDQLHSTVLALPPRPDQLLRAHTRTTPAALQRSAPNGVSHVVSEFMTYSCLRQKLKNDHSYCTSGRWRNGCTENGFRQVQIASYMYLAVIHYSLAPRPPHRPAFDHLQYAEMEGGGEWYTLNVFFVLNHNVRKLQCFRQKQEDKASSLFLQWGTPPPPLST